jgi:hypothetical protein
MVTISPAIRRLAKQLLTGGGSAPHKSPNSDLDQAVLACEKLRVPLTKLVGTTGFSMLLARAVALAMQKDPSLIPLRVGKDGTLTGIEAVREGLNGSHPAHEGGAIVVTELLGLLVSFIGGSLTLTLVREAWPDAWLDLTVTDSAKETP